MPVLVGCPAPRAGLKTDSFSWLHQTRPFSLNCVDTHIPPSHQEAQQNIQNTQHRELKGSCTLHTFSSNRLACNHNYPLTASQHNFTNTGLVRTANRQLIITCLIFIVQVNLVNMFNPHSPTYPISRHSTTGGAEGRAGLHHQARRPGYGDAPTGV